MTSHAFCFNGLYDKASLIDFCYQLSITVNQVVESTENQFFIGICFFVNGWESISDWLSINLLRSYSMYMFIVQMTKYRKNFYVIKFAKKKKSLMKFVLTRLLTSSTNHLNHAMLLWLLNDNDVHRSWKI